MAGSYSGTNRSPDPAVVRRDRQTNLLERDDCFQIELAAMKFLDIVAADRKPEWHLPLNISEIQGHEAILRPVESGEQQNPVSLIAVPIVEEEEFSMPQVRPITAYSKKRPDQCHQLLPKGVVEKVPTERAE